MCCHSRIGGLYFSSKVRDCLGMDSRLRGNDNQIKYPLLSSRAGGTSFIKRYALLEGWNSACAGMAINDSITTCFLLSFPRRRESISQLVRDYLKINSCLRRNNNIVRCITSFLSSRNISVSKCCHSRIGGLYFSSKVRDCLGMDSPPARE
ncbi:Uncharacterised protein [Legionella wadsworthii]|uniref:Uncharacterized protein n=1 Tax=Legionella wadsworthii TaxID=28088 RepID=A0A378M0P5_9GAMM|nr:Uncharacterised protein [Legionella wadsworthii]